MDRQRIDLFAPMLMPLVGLIAGILVAQSGAGVIPGACVMLAGIVVYELVIRFSDSPVKAYRLRGWHSLWAFLLFAGAGIIVADFNRPASIPDNMADSAEFLSGAVCEISSMTNGDVAVVELSAVVNTDGTVRGISPVRVRLHSDNIPADVDDIITFPYDLSPITDSPNVFNTGFADYMNRKGCLYTCDVPEKEISVNGCRPTFHGHVWRLRDGMIRFIENTPLAKSTQNFLITVLIGDRSYLSDNMHGLFADAGISHILALSGMHVSIIAGILMFILFPFNLLGAYRWRYGLIIPIIWAYAIITGFSPSTVRAALMTTCVMVCILLERKNSGWNALLLSVFMILLIDPSALFDIGLQLSFVCVASLVFFVNRLNTVNRHDHPKAFAVVSMLLASLAATAASWALVSYSFGILPTMFIPANIVVLPLLPIYISIAIVYFASCAFGYPLQPLVWVLDNGFYGLTAALKWITDGETSAIRYTVPSVTVILWLLAVLLLAVWMHRNPRRWVLAGSVSLACMALVAIPVFADAANDDGMIFQNTPDRPRIAVKQGNNVRTIAPDVNAVTLLSISGHRVIVADTRAVAHDIVLGCEYLLVTRSCTTPLSVLDSVYRPGLIVLHTSVPRKREQLLIHEADSLNIRVHSIRLNAPLRVGL